MKPRSTLLLATLLVLIIATVLPDFTVYAADKTLGQKPVKYTTFLGADNGNPVSVLQVQDQSKTADNPSRYVLFSTPGTAYRGVQEFFLSKTYKPADVTGLSLRVNFKGPAKSTQVWAWKLYDWNARKWVKVGDNARVTANAWKLLAFNVPTPQRFFNANGKIRVLLISNNRSGNAKIDFEILRVTVAPASGCGAQGNPAFEDRVLTLINAERTKEGIAPLRRDDKLDAAARRHSNDMACNNFMSHVGSDGTSSWDRISQAGYAWSMTAENIAAGYPTPESVVEGWMGSASHKSNILNPGLKEIGIAYAFKSSAYYGHYWTTDFAAPR